ncbi:unnamed protein product [Nezara viridula]|uniref:Uncharacterized protein n=1 Tax=Nezara viridula TaxID=85310 RepID=A0A9P0MV45_NEZVI|nr:unnamed protein product [Nezara viridula]
MTKIPIRIVYDQELIRNRPTAHNPDLRNPAKTIRADKICFPASWSSSLCRSLLSVAVAARCIRLHSRWSSLVHVLVQVSSPVISLMFAPSCHVLLVRCRSGAALQIVAIAMPYNELWVMNPVPLLHFSKQCLINNADNAALLPFLLRLAARLSRFLAMMVHNAREARIKESLCLSKALPLPLFLYPLRQPCINPTGLATQCSLWQNIHVVSPRWLPESSTSQRIRII